MVRLICMAVMLTLLPLIANGASMNDEIVFLLNTQVESDCTFVRNDISYNSEEFHDHLQSKMRNNNEIFRNTEEFIEKIATRSATSNSPYVALCDGDLKIVRDWFAELLASYRNSRRP